MAFEYLYGTQPVLTALRQRSRRITQLLLYDTERRHQTNPHLGQILALARQYVLPIQHTTRLQLDGLCHQRPHQNVALQVDALKVQHVEQPVEGDSCAAVLVDVIDPQNLGAVIRSAAYFGIPQLYLSGGCAPLTPVVSKASAGALEFYHSRIAIVPKINRFLDTARSAGFRILATGASWGGGRVDTQEALHESRKTLVLFGNEGSGLRPSILERCDATLTIPVSSLEAHEFGLDSLNVSVAAAIVMSQMIRATPPT